MKNSMFKSFRFEIVLYSFLSLFYTLLTELFIYFGLSIFNNVFWNINNNGNTPYGSQKKVIRKKDIHNVVTYINENNFLNQQELQLKSYLLLIIVIAVIIGIILFISYFLILTRKFAVSLEEISTEINEISAGNFNVRMKIKNEDEFSLIGSRLNKMADDIKKIIESQRKSEQMKNELIVSVAHDLRTPLTSMIGYLDIVLKDKDLTLENRKKYVEIAYSNSRRLEKLVEDLLTYTKFSFGEVTMEREKVDMVKFMEQLGDEFYPSFQEYKLNYEFASSQPVAVIYADGNLLARAFANLIENAVKYGKDGKNINIKLVKDSDKIIISITNYGELIPPNDIENIFDRFYRVESSRSRETGGSGLGLAIAKSIILMHEGTITARSDFDGTVFEVTLNRSDEKS